MWGRPVARISPGRPSESGRRSPGRKEVATGCDRVLRTGLHVVATLMLPSEDHGGPMSSLEMAVGPYTDVRSTIIPPGRRDTSRITAVLTCQSPAAGFLGSFVQRVYSREPTIM
jgi:hypothetical protein